MAKGSYNDLPKGKHDMPMPKGSMNSGKGHDPQTKCLEKHPIKSGFFTKKVAKGQG